jgi:hypothetical protein
MFIGSVSKGWKPAPDPILTTIARHPRYRCGQAGSAPPQNGFLRGQKA